MSVLSAILLLAAAHPTPRRRVRPFEEPAMERFRCPSGPYLQRLGQRDRSARLQRHVQTALARGLVPSVLDATPRALQNVTQMYTHESPAWPKPARCRRRQAEVCEVNPHFCLALPSGNSPRASLVADKYQFEFRQVRNKPRNLDLLGARFVLFRGRNAGGWRFSVMKQVESAPCTSCCKHEPSR